MIASLRQVVESHPLMPHQKVKPQEVASSDGGTLIIKHLTTKFQRLWPQNQAQRYLSSKNRGFSVYDRPTLAWLAMLVFVIVILMSDQLLV